ncbi:7-cyano-7-deazaguanine synthase QueC [bacterium]|nr:7-cyano-7-deazaguanine synthase QueC [candidate division CSSED10-310 bacterium]
MDISRSSGRWAVVVASGGLDSCVAATLAAREYRLAMLHARYGQRTSERELRAFHDISSDLKADRRLVIHLDYFSSIGGSSLTDDRMTIPVDGVKENIIPLTYVPFRNANLFAAATAWAEVIGAEKIYVGINQIDSSGYPDCTQEFLDAFNRLVRCGTRPDTQVQIVAPLISLSKQGIVRLGLDIGAPMDKSWSCYQRSDRACGICDSCRLRLDGFRANNAIDPIPYA